MANAIKLIKKLGWPNTVTLARVVPAYFAFFTRDWETALALYLLAAAVGDIADGWLARRINRTSNAGKFLDPLVDKIINLSFLGKLTVEDALPAWVFEIALLLDIVSEAYYAAGCRKGKIQANYFGKIKTWLQVACIALLLWHPDQKEAATALLLVAILAAMSSLCLKVQIIMDPPEERALKNANRSLKTEGKP